MNKKRTILMICLGILAVMLLTSVGSASPASEAYVHVIHYYDGTPIGMTNDEECSEADIVTLEQGQISFSNMIQTTYNGKSYVVDRIELHNELAEVEIRMLKDGDYQGLAENNYDPNTEIGRITEVIIINSALPDSQRVKDIFNVVGCGTSHVATWPSDTTNIRKIIDVWYLYSATATPGNNNGLTGSYPLTGEITYPQQYSSLRCTTDDDDSWFDITNPEAEVSNGGHYVLKIFYSSTGGQRSSNGDRVQVTFYPNDGSDPIITTVSRGAYVSVPPSFASRNTITGWYTDDGSFANAWNFGTDKVTQDMALYAKSSSTGGERTNEQGADGQGTSGQGGDGTGGQGQEATPNPNPNQNDDQKPSQNTSILWILFIIALFGLMAIGIYLWKKNQT